MQSKPALILAFLITALIASNFYLLKHTPQQEQTSTITRAIDGDTIEITNGEKVRLENINTPEKNQPGYEEAKSFLQQFENSTIKIQKTGVDKYKRTLAKIYTQDYLNLKIIEEGLANKFLVDDAEAKLFAKAEEKAIENQKGLWKKSEYSECFETEIDKKKEIVSIINHCEPINLKDWTLKDESRKKYNFPDIVIGEINLHTKNGTNNKTDIFWGEKGDVWNDDRDSLYLFDEKSNLVNHNTYGY